MTEHIAADIEAEELQEERTTTEFHIDVKWYEERGRSFVTVARSRMCRTCRQRAEDEAQARAASSQRPSSKRGALYGDDPVRVITEHCGREPDYVAPGMPLMEAVFRLFLASGNQPATADDIVGELRQRESYGRYWPPLTGKSLERMLREDDYYGFCLLATEGKEPTPPPG